MAQRNAFGIHTDVLGMDVGLLKRSSLAKVLFGPTDAGIVRAWKDIASPNAYWLGRTSLDQDGTPEGELQRRYRSASSQAEVQAVGVWYAEWIASWALSAGLGYFFWEAGPNEKDDMTEKAVWYTEAFIRRCLELGLKPAGGMYSFGKPSVVKWDGVDGWVMWAPVFNLIDGANRGKAVPEAAYTFHSYALNRDMMGSVDYAIGRYRLCPYKGPAFIGELSYAYYDRPSSTEEILRQLKAVNEYMGQDDRLCGFAWYDIRKHTDYQWAYMYRDMERALAQQNLPILPITVTTGTTPTPPPAPEPSGLYYAQVVYGVNQRAEPSSGASLVGSLDTSSPRTRLVVELPAINGYVRVLGQNCWVLYKNLKLLERIS